MSASDAAPLPRLGEVFFDVRGSSRSMRLSWYADTGVAVFSIWQGGMCTGTFRLPIADLPRMVDTLQRGPAGADLGVPGEAFGDAGMGAPGDMQGLEPLPGDEFGEYQPGAPGYGPGAPPEYPAERPDRLAGLAHYPADRSDPLAGTAQFPADRSDPLAGTAQFPGRVPDYPAEPGGHLTGPAEYPAGPPDSWSGPADRRHSGSSYPPRHPDASYPGPGADGSYPAPRPGDSYPGAGPDGSYAPRRSDASYPGGRPDAPYPGERPEAPYPGRPDASYPGGLPDASYPPGSDPLYPGPGGGGRRSRRAAERDGRRGGLADDPYLGGTGPADYPAEPPRANYRPASLPSPASPPPAPPSPFGGHDGAAGRSPADYDYPTQYGAPEDDEIAPGPPPESFPYGRPRGNRGPGGRHADPDTQFD